MPGGDGRTRGGGGYSFVVTYRTAISTGCSPVALQPSPQTFPILHPPEPPQSFRYPSLRLSPVLLCAAEYSTTAGNSPILRRPTLLRARVRQAADRAVTSRATLSSESLLGSARHGPARAEPARVAWNTPSRLPDRHPFHRDSTRPDRDEARASLQTHQSTAARRASLSVPLTHLSWMGLRQTAHPARPSLPAAVLRDSGSRCRPLAHNTSEAMRREWSGGWGRESCHRQVIW